MAKIEKTDERTKITLRVDPLTEFRIMRWGGSPEFASRNDFVSKAVNFYADYLDGLKNNVLPTAIQSAIDGRLGVFEDRISNLLYKVAVETDMVTGTLVDAMDFDPSYLSKRRAESVKNVKSTNGLISFEDKAKRKDGGD